jgi:hypothetical protein
MALAFALTLLILHRRRGFLPILTVFSGWACGFGAELAWYLHKGAFHDLLYANWLWPLSGYNTVNAVTYGALELVQPLVDHFSPQRSPIAAAFLIIFLSLPFLLWVTAPLLVPLLGAFQRAAAFRREIVPYWIAAFALFGSEMHRRNLGHVQYGGALLIVLFFAFCEWQPQPSLRLVAIAAMACLTVHAAIDLAELAANRIPLKGRRGQLYAQAKDGTLDFLSTHIHPGENVFVYPYKPVYYFWADVRNPTRFSLLMYHSNTLSQFQEAAKDLDVKKLRYVLWNTLFWGDSFKAAFPAYRQPPRRQLIMEPYLETHYHQIGFENGIKILERN